MVVFRYLTKEVAAATSAITVVLLLVFLSNQFVHYIALAADGKIPAGIVLRLMMIAIPHLLGILLSIGLFLAILFAYGRLYADGEMTVLCACGMSQVQLLGMTLVMAIIVNAISATSMLWLDPLIMAHKYTLLAKSGPATLLQTVLPGRLRQSKGRIYYVESVSSDRSELNNVFMAQRISQDVKNPSSNRRWMILTAKSARAVKDKKTDDSFIVFSKGYRYSGTPGLTNYRVIKFNQYGIRLHEYQSTYRKKHGMMPSLKLWRLQFTSNKAAAEIQWRLSIPISGMILAFMAVPLSRIKPRQGKYANILPSIVVYVFYANLIFMSRDWLENGEVSPWIGIWWVHGVMSLVTISLYLKLLDWRSIKHKFLKRVKR